MELKRDCVKTAHEATARLNRTFYGIETSAAAARAKSTDGLNRTFYGIETDVFLGEGADLLVLIVPFMELKQA